MYQGNDAAYTMQALIGISFAALTTNNKAHTEDLSTRLEVAATDAKQRIIEEDEEWVMADEEGGDGGHAVPLLPSEEVKAAADLEQAMNRGKKADEKADARDWQQKHTVKGVRKSSKVCHVVESLSRKLLIMDQQSAEGEIRFHDTNEEIVRQMGAHSIGTSATADSTQIDDAKKTGYVPPHLRGLVKPQTYESESHLPGSSNKPKVVLPPLSKRLEKRLLMMEDDDMM